MMRRHAPWILGLSVACLSASAQAKSSAESAFSYERAWNTSVRYVRVDQNLRVSEKDMDAGYLAFDYVSADSARSVSPGTVELVRLDNGKVRIAVNLSKMPKYHEDVFLQGIVKKLREDYGDPPASPPPSKPTAPPTPAAPPQASPEKRGSDSL